jgi:predicted nucleic acid-binding protein
MRIAVDTNPLIYLLNGNETIADILDGKECWISIVTELELYAKKGMSESQIQEVDALVESCFVLDILPEIKVLAKSILQKYNLKLPDAIVAATAQYFGLPLFTADKQFRQIEELETVLIQL